MRDRDALLRTRARMIVAIASSAIVRLEAPAFRHGDARDARGGVGVRLDPGCFDVGTGPVFGVAGRRRDMMRARGQRPDARFDAAVVARAPRR